MISAFGAKNAEKRDFLSNFQAYWLIYLFPFPDYGQIWRVRLGPNFSVIGVYRRPSGVKKIAEKLPKKVILLNFQLWAPVRTLFLFHTVTPGSKSEFLKILSNCPNKQSDSDPISPLGFSRNAHLFLSPQSLTSSTSLSSLVSFTPFSKNLSFH